ncbi:MAG: universal stress protein [Nitrospirae bacterium]|nr:universal stress protein [Nitrospirota bacterium]
MKILICYDGSPASQRAMEKSIEFFKQKSPEIILLTVVEQPLDASLENEAIFDKWRQDRHKELKIVSSYVADHGLDVDSILAIGDPRKMILEIINKKLPDMVVVARRGKTEMEKMLLGSVSAFLVRHSTRPLLIMT